MFKRNWLNWVLLIISAFLLQTSSMAAIQKTTADLNGDGKQDAIVLNSTDDIYTLTVNGISVKNSLECLDDKSLSVIDIDGRDNWKEVMIDTMGPSEDPACRIYAYDGKKLFEVGYLEGYRTYSGVGFVYTRDWMGFWDRTDKYTLNQKTHKLELVPQELYYLTVEQDGKSQNVEGVVTETFAIYSTRKRDQVLANLAPKSAIQIVACDTSPVEKMPNGETDDYFCDWYLIRSHTGLLGWARFADFDSKVDGLLFAD